jgi:ABC-2 type transport system ATP-binding protein
MGITGDLRSRQGAEGEGGAAVVIRALRVVRRGSVVIPGLDLDIPAGQITGLLGPSGCGKSTLMRTIVGVQVVAGGTCEVLGLPAGHPDLRAQVGYVTQEPSVYADLTVRENLAYFARIYGASAAAVETTIGHVDLADKADAPVRELSGGQRSRVSLAVALLNSPALLVLDEPTVGLDPVLRRDLWVLFRRLCEAGATLLVSSHVMDEAVHCDRLLLMREGAILANAPLEEILADTGADDLEAAFLHLVDQANASEGSR